MGKHFAVGTVAPDKVAARYALQPGWAFHCCGHRRVIPAHADDFVPTTHLGARLPGMFVEQPLESLLRQPQPLHRRLAQWRQVDMQVAER